MASNGKGVDVNLREKFVCKYCKKGVVSYEKCAKCLEVFHPACLRQSASAKGGSCQHEALPTCSILDSEVRTVTSMEEREIGYLKRIIEELEDKNRLLEENCQLLREKVKFLEKGEKSVEKNKAGKTVAPKENGGLSRLSSSVTVVPAVTVMPRTTGMSNGSEAFDLPQSTDENKSRTIENAEVESEKHESWNKVVGRRNRKVSKMLQDNRPKPVEGSGGDGGLKIAERRAFLFISGLVPETAEGDVLNFLKSKNLTAECTCQKMKTRKQNYKSSFKLGVPFDDRSKYMAPEIWPKGVFINHFLNIQRQISVFSPNGAQAEVNPRAKISTSLPQ